MRQVGACSAVQLVRDDMVSLGKQQSDGAPDDKSAAAASLDEPQASRDGTPWGDKPLEVHRVQLLKRSRYTRALLRRVPSRSVFRAGWLMCSEVSAGKQVMMGCVPCRPPGNAETFRWHGLFLLTCNMAV
jgi:hypothetical protein